jgi:hypothetical protein
MIRLRFHTAAFREIAESLCYNEDVIFLSRQVIPYSHMIPTCAFTQKEEWHP